MEARIADIKPNPVPSSAVLSFCFVMTTPSLPLHLFSELKSFTTQIILTQSQLGGQTRKDKNYLMS